MKNVTYIISNIDKALEFEWVVLYLAPHFNLSFILLNPKPSDFSHFLSNHQIPAHELLYRGKRDYLFVLLKVIRLLYFLKPQIVHCHLMNANLVGLPAAWFLRVKKRIYTRHHSSFHHIYHPHAVKYDELCNKLATDIIAISNLVKTILVDWEAVKAKKVTLIPHGIDYKMFSDINLKMKQELENKYRLTGKKPVIGVISRYTHWKGVQFIMPAFKEILTRNPEACLVLANAKQGEFKDEIALLLNYLPPDSYREIVFEPNIAQLYHCFDVFVHTPIDNHSEAFGQIYIEALAAGIPSVFTASGIGNDLQNLDLAEFVPYQNSEAIIAAIDKILRFPELSKIKAKKASRYIQEHYTIQNKINLLSKLYQCE